MSSQDDDTGSEPTGDECTWLFVPGDRPDRFEKAIGSGADAVICDLEDAVVADHKSEARANVTAWLADGGRAWVRINGVDTPWFAADVDTLAGSNRLLGLMIPKSEDPKVLQAVRSRLGPGRGVIALIETAAGIIRSNEIALAADRLAFGSIDYAADIEADGGNESLLFARSALVVASRGAGKPRPIDSPTTSLNDPTAAGIAARYGRGLGFGGKLCIHPSQVAPVAAAFAPDATELTWARDVLAAASTIGDGASRSQGQMIDKAVVERARRVLARATP